MAAPQSVSVSVNIPSGSSAADYYVCHGMTGEWKLTKAYFVPSVTLAAHATNTMIFTLGQGTTSSHVDIEGTGGSSGGTLAGMVVCQFEQYRA